MVLGLNPAGDFMWKIWKTFPVCQQLLKEPEKNNN